MFKVENKNTTRTTSMTSFWCFIVTLKTFHTIFSVSIVDFEQVIVSWFKPFKATFPS